MSRYRILICGPFDGARQKLVSMLSGKPTLSLHFRQAESFTGLHAADVRFDALFFSCAAYSPAQLASLRLSGLPAPVLFYGSNPDHEATRSAFLCGADDVLNTETLHEDALYSALQHAAARRSRLTDDPDQPGFPDLQALTQRGLCFERKVREGSLPFPVSGEGARLLLRANVLCTDCAPLWQKKASDLWMQAFGQEHSFILKITPDELHIGVIIEQDPFASETPDPDLHLRLETCFAALRNINCIAAVSAICSDSPGLSDLYRLDRTAELVYYLDESRVILPDTVGEDAVFSSNLYTAFFTAASSNNLGLAIECIDAVVRNLKSVMPSPRFARMKLNRFLWDFAAAVGTQDERFMDAEINISNINSHRNDIVRILSEISRNRRGDIMQSPLDELVRRIEFNPGQSISIDQAAQETNFSRSHFCKLFRARTGMSFNEFLTAKRMDSACRLLMQTAMRVDEVAQLVGISNVWYFKKLFVRATGVSPEAWREGVRPPSAQGDASDPSGE